jgi:hypothetical protein
VLPGELPNLLGCGRVSVAVRVLGEATGALWRYGKPMNKANTALLMNQISTINFGDGSNIKYLPQCKSYNKMLGVQIITILDFRDHLKKVTKDVRLIANKILT